MENQHALQPPAPYRTGRQTVRWLFVALLAGLAMGLIVQLARAVATSPPGGAAVVAGSVIAVPGQISRDAYGLYLVDLENRTICVYQYLPTSKKLRLQAARTFAYDTRLDELNTEPSPREIKRLVEQQRRLTDTPGEEGVKPPAEKPSPPPADKPGDVRGDTDG